jgi:hypothetical protein
VRIGFCCAVNNGRQYSVVPDLTAAGRVYLQGYELLASHRNDLGSALWDEIDKVALQLLCPIMSEIWYTSLCLNSARFLRYLRLLKFFGAQST